MPKKTQKSKSPKPLKVGFDLDGVLLYNPARIIRPIVAGIKSKFLKKKKTKFYVPKTKSSQFLFYLLHKSSFMPAPGFDLIRNLVDSGLIEAHIVTARFDYLKKDFDKWLNSIKAEDYFVSWHHNSKNEQPHEFKLKKIQELDLDIFIEDNWDIVSHVNQSLKKTTKPCRMLWITNILDMHTIDYPDKYLTLRESLMSIIRKQSASTK